MSKIPTHLILSSLIAHFFPVLYRVGGSREAEEGGQTEGEERVLQHGKGLAERERSEGMD